MHIVVLHLIPSNLAMMIIIDAGLSCSSIFSSLHLGSNPWHDFLLIHLELATFGNVVRFAYLPDCQKSYTIFHRSSFLLDWALNRAISYKATRLLCRSIEFVQLGRCQMKVCVSTFFIWDVVTKEVCVYLVIAHCICILPSSPGALISFSSLASFRSNCWSKHPNPVTANRVLENIRRLRV